MLSVPVDQSIGDDAKGIEDVSPEQCGAFFHWANPRDPQKARRRFGKLYWLAWKRLIMSFFLSAFGAVFLVVGMLCMALCEEFSRGVAFFFAGFLMATPGFYGATILFQYVRGKKGFTYKMLPEYE